MRIVSLLPSATEMICGLGLAEQLVGVSHECDFPPNVTALPKVTGTLMPAAATSGEIDALVRERVRNEQALYSLDEELFCRLRPDVVVTQTLCDVCAVAESEVLRAIHQLDAEPAVITLSPTCLQDIWEGMHAIGRATGAQERARQAIADLERRVQVVHAQSRSMNHRPSVVLLEWVDPPFAAGHWNPELIELAGGQCAIGEAGERSETILWKDVVRTDPDVLVIACCGFDAERSREDLRLLESKPEWNALSAVKSGRVFVGDGSQFFNRPGPRLVESLEMLAHAIDPHVHPLEAGTPRLLRV